MPIGLCAALGYAAVFGSLPKFFIVCVVAYLFNMDKSIYALQKRA